MQQLLVPIYLKFVSEVSISVIVQLQKFFFTKSCYISSLLMPIYHIFCKIFFSIFCTSNLYPT